MPPAMHFCDLSWLVDWCVRYPSHHPTQRNHCTWYILACAPSHKLDMFSYHQDLVTFSAGSQPKPSFATNTGKGDKLTLHTLSFQFPAPMYPNRLNPIHPPKKGKQHPQTATLQKTNIAIGNPPFADVFPIKNGGFPLLC